MPVSGAMMNDHHRDKHSKMDTLTIVHAFLHKSHALYQKIYLTTFQAFLATNQLHQAWADV